MTTNMTNLQTQADKILLKNYSPAAVLVNAAGDIPYINGRTGKYLEPAAGKANWNIHVMAREPLQHQLDRTQDNVIDGAVITFTDISEVKLLESELRKIKPTT
jgi:hypothetical protein